jgi:hypothetical protein
MEREGRRLARAEKPSMFRSRFTVWLGRRSCQLQKVAPGKRSFVLLEDGTEVGRLFRRGFFKRRMRLDLPMDWPLAAQAFIFWLALVVWAREDAAMAASQIDVVCAGASAVPSFALDGPVVARPSIPYPRRRRQT